MPKTLTRFVCQSCGRAAAKAQGRCPTCGEWDTYVEEVVEGSGSRRVASGNGANPRSADQFNFSPNRHERNEYEIVRSDRKKN